MNERTIVVEYVSSHHFDIRKTGNGRWIDQKCTYDVLCFSADCIIDYLGDESGGVFTSPALWRSDYAKRQVSLIFSKPDTNDREAIDEFNKFFRQPPKLLEAAGVLRDVGRKRNAIQFVVEDWEMLHFIAARDYQSLEFLTSYIEKTLHDSGLYRPFDSFFESQTEQAIQDLKNTFRSFCFRYTPIKNDYEPNRILAKVLNPLAFRLHLHGIERGHLSKQAITRDQLAYNRPNWRDVLAGKDKHVARRRYTPPEGVDTSFESRVNESMQLVKRFNDRWRNAASEVLDEFAAADKANAAHHIFPRWQYKELATYPENIAVLTTAQHMGRAHCNGKTHEIDRAYQKECILAKIKVIQANVEGRLGTSVIYSLDRLIHVLDVGLDTNGFFARLPQIDYGIIETHLELFY